MDQSKDTGQQFDITRVARSHAPSALAELARLGLCAESETARIAAIKEVLALACGKGKEAADEAAGPLVVRFTDDWARPPAAG